MNVSPTEASTAIVNGKKPIISMTILYGNILKTDFITSDLILPGPLQHRLEIIIIKSK